VLMPVLPIYGALQDCAETINEFADEDIKAEFLPRVCQGETCSMDLTEPDAGSDLQAVRLKATYDEREDIWYLNGVKRFITNGDAHIKTGAGPFGRRFYRWKRLVIFCGR